MKRDDKRTREQKKADTASCLSFFCFLGILLLCVAYMVVNAG